ncbi:hypothetical protein OIU76_019825 [Salix suchowensis]|nr:hypothetical protein OIU76_019825 [Salix suchowensis]
MVRTPVLLFFQTVKNKAVKVTPPGTDSIPIGQYGQSLGCPKPLDHDLLIYQSRSYDPMAINLSQSRPEISCVPTVNHELSSTLEVPYLSPLHQSVRPSPFDFIQSHYKRDRRNASQYSWMYQNSISIQDPSRSPRPQCYFALS